MIRRTIIIVLLLGMTCIARGQTEYDYRYWFDSAEDIGTMGFHGADTWQQEVDVSSLKPSLHQIHLALLDDNGRVTSTFSQLFYKMMPELLQKAENVTYWYDINTSDRKDCAVVNGIFTIDGADQLATGLHKLTAVISNTSGDMASVVNTLFYIPYNRALEKYTGLYYWFDDGIHQHIDTTADGLYVLDTSHLMAGIHTVHIQTDNRFMSPAVSQMVYKMPYIAKEETPLKCIVSIDSQQVMEQNIVEMGGLVQVDVSHLSVGVHTMSALTVTTDETEQPLSAQSTLFYFGGLPGAETPTGYVYWFDNDEQHKYEGEMSAIITLQTNALGSGIHTVHIATNGEHTSPVVSQLFYVKPILNDNYTLRFWMDDDITTTKEYVLMDDGTMEFDVDNLPYGDHVLRAMLVNNNGLPINIGSEPFTTLEAILGDANMDRGVDEADIETVLRYMTGSRPMLFSMRGADINRDETINVADIVNIVRIMCDTYNGDTQPNAYVNGELTCELSDDVLTVSLQNGVDYTAFQMTITLPEGVKVEQTSLYNNRSANHVVYTTALDDDRLLVTVYSPDNSALLEQSGKLFNLALSQKPDGEINMNDIIFVTPEGQQYHMNAPTIDIITGIRDLTIKQSAKTVWHTIGGLRIDYPTKAGVYIMNGKKMVIK